MIFLLSLNGQQKEIGKPMQTQNIDRTSMAHSEARPVITILLAFMLVGAMVGSAVHTNNGAVESVSNTVAEVTDSADAVWLASKYGYLNDEDITYLISMYQLRNCYIVSVILTPAAGLACSAGSIT